VFYLKKSCIFASCITYNKIRHKNTELMVDCYRLQSTDRDRALQIKTATTASGQNVRLPNFKSTTTNQQTTTNPQINKSTN